MAIKNREKLIQTIKEDCLIRQAYLLDGATCAIGGLARAAGVDMEAWFAGLSDDHERELINTTCISDYGLDVLSDAIEEEFGLDIDNLQQIQIKNDHYSTPEERQEAILEYIAELP